MVRDPRDVIISGANYHVKSDEPWLDAPQDRFGGRSYRQEIQSLAPGIDRLRFEMNHRGQRTIRLMAQDTDSRLLRVRFEDLFSWESAPATLESISSWLGLTARESRALSAAHASSHLHNRVKKSTHVTRGVGSRWLDEWPDELNGEFMTLFQDVIDSLPYDLQT
jgi:hypothetical protein